MFYFVIPYYNSFERLCFSLDSILRLKLEIPFEVHVFNNASVDFHPETWGEYEKEGVKIHHFDELLDMPNNWNRCCIFLNEQTKVTGWYMLHVGDVLTHEFKNALIDALINASSDKRMQVCNSNLRKISSDIDLLERKNFPNITQIIFIGSSSPFTFATICYPLFDLLTFARIIGEYDVSFSDIEIVFRSDGIEDASTTVKWYPAAFSAILRVIFVNQPIKRKMILLDHLIRLGAGDLYRKLGKMYEK